MRSDRCLRRSGCLLYSTGPRAVLPQCHHGAFRVQFAGLQTTKRSVWRARVCACACVRVYVCTCLSRGYNTNLHGFIPGPDALDGVSSPAPYAMVFSRVPAGAPRVADLSNLATAPTRRIARHDWAEGARFVTQRCVFPHPDRM